MSITNTKNNKNHTFDLKGAIDHLKNSSKVKFEEKIDMVIELDMNPQKDNVRGAIILPFGVAKQKKICVFTDENLDITDVELGNEELIEKIKNGYNLNVDICLTTPKFFPKLISIAKTLSKNRLMPSVKDQTVTNSIKETVNDIQSGKKLNFKNDSAGYIQLSIGKIKQPTDEIIANLSSIIKYVRTFNKVEKNKHFIKSVKLNTTMSEGSLVISSRYINNL